jgi:hypothetical protein
MRVPVLCSTTQRMWHGPTHWPQMVKDDVLPFLALFIGLFANYGFVMLIAFPRIDAEAEIEQVRQLASNGGLPQLESNWRSVDNYGR